MKLSTLRSALAVRGRFVALVACALVALGAGEAQAQQQGIGHVSWSPDGTMIAFYALWYGDAEVFVLTLENNGLLQVSDNDETDAGPRFSADSRSLIYRSGSGPGNRIVRTDLATGATENVVSLAGKTLSFPALGPDGAVYFSESVAGASMRESSDSILRILPHSGQVERVVDDGHVNRGAFWSEARDRLFFLSSRDGLFTPYSANADGSDPRPVFEIDKPGVYEDGGEFGTAFMGAGYPQLDTSGRYMTFWADTLGEGPQDFHVGLYDFETGETTRVTQVPKVNGWVAIPAISPDGAQIVYPASVDGRQPWGLFIMNRDGSAHRKLFPPDSE